MNASEVVEFEALRRIGVWVCGTNPRSRHVLALEEMTLWYRKHLKTRRFANLVLREGTLYLRYQTGFREAPDGPWIGFLKPLASFDTTLALSVVEAAWLYDYKQERLHPPVPSDID